MRQVNHEEQRQQPSCTRLRERRGFRFAARRHRSGLTTNNLLLTRQELEALTGKRQPAAMTSWLHRRNWVHEVGDRKGDIPKVARAYFDAKMTGAPLPGQRIGPRLEFMSGSIRP